MQPITQTERKYWQNGFQVRRPHAHYSLAFTIPITSFAVLVSFSRPRKIYSPYHTQTTNETYIKTGSYFPSLTLYRLI